jgi:hypothetical protein
MGEILSGLTLPRDGISLDYWTNDMDSTRPSIHCSESRHLYIRRNAIEF